MSIKLRFIDKTFMNVSDTGAGNLPKMTPRADCRSLVIEPLAMA